MCGRLIHKSHSFSISNWAKKKKYQESLQYTSNYYRHETVFIFHRHTRAHITHLHILLDVGTIINVRIVSVNGLLLCTSPTIIHFLLFSWFIFIGFIRLLCPQVNGYWRNYLLYILLFSKVILDHGMIRKSGSNNEWMMKTALMLITLIANFIGRKCWPKPVIQLDFSFKIDLLWSLSYLLFTNLSHFIHNVRCILQLLV